MGHSAAGNPWRAFRGSPYSSRSLRPGRAETPSIVPMNAFPSPLRGWLILGIIVAGSAGWGGGGGGGSSGMSIVSCSLSCADSASNPGVQVSCGVTDVFVNPEITFTFSAPIDASTVTTNSFRVTEFGTGKTPAGSLTVDPDDPRTLIYRPQLTFDSAGNPIFGFEE